MPSRAKLSTGCSRRNVRTSPAKAVSAAVSAKSISSVPLHQLLNGGPEVRAGAVEMRMHGKGAAEQTGRLLILADGQMTETLSGQGAEVIRVSRERLAAVGDRAREVPGQVAHGGALVPGLGEVGRRLDQLREDVRRPPEILPLHRLDALAQPPVELRPARLMPELPQLGGRLRGAHGIVTPQHGQRLALR